MIIEEGYLGYLKYDGNAVEEGVMDARLSAEALLGFDKAFRYFVQKENPSWRNEDLNLPVRIEKGCWQILIPAGLTVFAGYYLKATAEKAAQDGLFETGFAKDLNKILKSALVSVKWVVRISKHVGALGNKAKVADSKIPDMDHVIVFNESGEPLTVSKKYFDLYCDCPPSLLGKCASVINEGRELEIGSFENNQIVDPVRIFLEERMIFYREEDEEQEILFPEMEHGLSVVLDGEITRATESTNTLGLRYKEHVLFCKPAGGARIASFKQRIISQQDGHIFPKVRMTGIVDREDKYGGFKAKRPCIVFSDIQRLENVSGTFL